MCKLCFFLDLVRGSLSVVRFMTRHTQSATVYNSSARQLLLHVSIIYEVILKALPQRLVY